MTTSKLCAQWDAMSDEQRNLKVALLYGWKLVTKNYENKKHPVGYNYEHTAHGAALNGGGFHGWGYQNTPEAAAQSLPNYTRNLNAIAQAVAAMPKNLRGRYSELIQYFANKQDDKGIYRLEIFAAIEATAEQRSKNYWLAMVEHMEKK